jgi:S1-C subfamily serine protease
MRISLKAVALVASLAVLATGCSTTYNGSISLDPHQPRQGTPVNPVGLVAYLERESTNLLQQGKCATNLLRQMTHQTCGLKLASVSTRVPAGTELAGTLETSVAVIGRLVKTGKAPHLNDTATGFFLTESGALVTCWHVVNWNPIVGLTVMTRDGRVCPVSGVLAVDTNNDLAILQVEGQGFVPLPIAATARQGEPVWVLSHPYPWFYMLTTGIVSGYYNIPRTSSDLSAMDITADFAIGSSGAPVCNEHGAVVGIARITQTLSSRDGTKQMVLKGCVPSSVLLNMIKQD